MSIPIKITPLGIPQSNYMPLTFIANEANSTISLTKTGNPYVQELKYRTNNSPNWNSYQIDQVITLQNIGDYVQFENNNNNLSTNGNNYVQFVMNGQIIAKGNIQSLLNYSMNCPNYCFFKLFSYCDSLISVPRLTASTLGTACYMRMFEYCTNITIAPQLPSVILSQYCYAYMFLNCTSLTSMPHLPAISLANDCYSNMFQNCTSLTSTTQLPFISAANNCCFEMFKNCTSLTSVTTTLRPMVLYTACYEGMFRNCSSLQTSPVLPATVLASNCYKRMFDSSGISVSPQLPATTLANDCYNRMFAYCPLIKSPNLPATNLADHCYYGMFHHCEILTTPCELPATTLAEWCYASMFSSCYKLKQSPYLHATTLVANCYNRMFQHCSDLECVKTAFENWNNGEDSTLYWLQGVSQTGSFVKDGNLYGDEIIRGISNIPSNWNIHQNNLTLTATQANSTVVLNAIGNVNYSNIQYRTSTNGQWLSYPINTTITLSNVDDLVQFRNIANTFSIDSNNYFQFSMTGSINGSGWIQSLMNYQNSIESNNYCYYNLFRDCSSLITPPELSVTELSSYCYNNMFRNCVNLTFAPKLLTTTVKQGCYMLMFYGCTTLTNGVDLPAENLATECYANMYSRCSNIVNGGKISAVELNTNSLQYMFYDCKSLISLEVDFSQWDNNNSNNWLYQTAYNTTGTFICPTNLVIPSADEHGIPANWSIVRK